MVPLSAEVAPVAAAAALRQLASSVALVACVAHVADRKASVLLVVLRALVSPACVRVFPLHVLW
jgi:hypothetical protein